MKDSYSFRNAKFGRREQKQSQISYLKLELHVVTMQYKRLRRENMTTLRAMQLPDIHVLILGPNCTVQKMDLKLNLR